MIGELFTISASNIGHAAIAAASRPIPEDAPATIQLASHEASGDDEVYIEVRTRRGFARDIRIGRAKVHAILRIDDPAACRASCQHFIDDRAEHVRAAVLEAQELEARFDDAHLDVGGEPYIVGGVATPQEQALAFVKRPGIFIGNPVRFDRVLAYLHGFEMALETAYGRQPRLHEYSDLLDEIKQELGSKPSADQELESISALEPILERLYSAAAAANAD